VFDGCAQRFWGALLRVIEIPSPDAGTSAEYEWLQWMTAVGDPSQGFINALVFVVFTGKVRHNYYMVFCKCRRYVCAVVVVADCRLLLVCINKSMNNSFG
jgi:hypothetical protein